MEIVILRPPHSSNSLRRQAASASSGVENVTKPKPLHALPSPASRTRWMRSILPTCLRAASMRFSSMFGGSLPRKQVSGSGAGPSSSSMASASRFTPRPSPSGSSLGATTTANGLGVVLAGRCFRAVSGIVEAGLSDRPWKAVRAFPLDATFPRAMHRQTCPAFNVWKGGRWYSRSMVPQTRYLGSNAAQSSVTAGEPTWSHVRG
mmetsp:Transcript_37739/g.87307  ORF Transcript_37739/g.87307 Transcript_37739/m.87307 type:complete len:205 (+) Transcript_37739:525-1139(+)